MIVWGNWCDCGSFGSLVLYKYHCRNVIFSPGGGQSGFHPAPQSNVPVVCSIVILGYKSNNKKNIWQKLGRFGRLFSSKLINHLFCPNYYFSFHQILSFYLFWITNYWLFPLQAHHNVPNHILLLAGNKAIAPSPFHSCKNLHPGPFCAPLLCLNSRDLVPRNETTSFSAPGPPAKYLKPPDSTFVELLR